MRKEIISSDGSYTELSVAKDFDITFNLKRRLL